MSFSKVRRRTRILKTLPLLQLHNLAIFPLLFAQALLLLFSLYYLLKLFSYFPFIICSSSSLVIFSLLFGQALLLLFSLYYLLKLFSYFPFIICSSSALVIFSLLFGQALLLLFSLYYLLKLFSCYFLFNIWSSSSLVSPVRRSLTK